MIPLPSDLMIGDPIRPASVTSASRESAEKIRDPFSFHGGLLRPQVTPARKILIVEDDLCLKTVLLSVLKKIDDRLDCIWVTSAEAAFEELKINKYDLIVCDQKLERKATGLDVWRAVLCDHPTTSFLLVSGMGIPRFLSMTEKLDRAPLYLPKPFDIKECHQYLNILLKGASYV